MRNSTVTAIPTLYRGIRFRSRLEARWAAFFDQCQWPWRYEPLDLDGYIPDFVLPFPHGPMLVEVKPALYLEDLRAHTAKIDASGWHHEAVLVSASYFDDDDCTSHHNSVAIGLLREKCEDDTYWWEAGTGFRCGCCGVLSFYHDMQSFRCRVRGCYDGDHYLGDPARADFAAAWATASNTTQWGQR
ncbi:MAG: hypothetical protein H0X64_08295 [Gemmatimonadaceae bacterium]|nr:hypothetical protein [Gemmatimonadaceae bacterium]